MTVTTRLESHAEAGAVAPEAFAGGRTLHFWGGRWRAEGDPALDATDTARAVRAALNEHRTWSVAGFEERRTRVSAAVESLTAHGALLAGTLGTGAEAERAVHRVLGTTRQCADEGGALLTGRFPLRGPVANIASRACPAPALLQALLMQTLAGNAAIAGISGGRGPAGRKERADGAGGAGGSAFLTLAVALAAPHGLPLTLVRAEGAAAEAALGRQDIVGCVRYPDESEPDETLLSTVTRRAAS
ncbi:hypothetical protein BAY61_23595 [Prauserella marina]|uniref:Uncharacterized protein n=1 Tax=Prauserella marina TaxID=530584 RepID=A0A222VUU3_9PSEU|nr:hypothetical protein [Prauserella marina]ASR37491.1 hypothetical protein BAY61_23595 [Prauserella marina]PWV74613.1 hypothetical protein DES30_10711 [Prauserella marina]SDD45305.1 hypothetical protein SAMN05421630_108240 [Prauserella marina]